MNQRPWLWIAAGAMLMLCALPASLGLGAWLVIFLEDRWGDAVPAGAVSWSAFAVIGSPLLVAGIRLINRARRMRAAHTDTVSDAAPDSRAPVLFLRSFTDDTRNAAPPDLARINPFVMATREENLVAALQGIGPVIAIGRPGERLPPLGAQRLYVNHDAWQAKVTDLMVSARLVVLALGGSEGLWWEIEQAIARVPPTRLLFHGEMRAFPAFLTRAQRWIPRPVALPRQRLVSLSPPELLLYFDADWNARFVRPGNAATLWRGDLKKPLLPVYRIALRPLFEQLGVPWTPPPVPWLALGVTIGALLLLFGGLTWLALTQPG